MHVARRFIDNGVAHGIGVAAFFDGLVSLSPRQTISLDRSTANATRYPKANANLRHAARHRSQRFQIPIMLPQPFRQIGRIRVVDRPKINDLVIIRYTEGCSPEALNPTILITLFSETLQYRFLFVNWIFIDYLT